MMFNTTNCAIVSPALYYLMAVFVVIGYMAIFLPMFMCLSVIFCLPCFLVRARETGIVRRAGMPVASEEAIQKLERVRFRKDFLPGESSLVDITANHEVMSIDSLVLSDSQNSSMLNITAEKATETEASPELAPMAASDINEKITTEVASDGVKEEAEAEEEEEQDETLRSFRLDDPSDALCTVCLAEYEDREILRLLPCGHHFHVNCIDQWLRLHANCPLCKRQIMTEVEENASSEQMV